MADRDSELVLDLLRSTSTKVDALGDAVARMGTISARVEEISRQLSEIWKRLDGIGEELRGSPTQDGLAHRVRSLEDAHKSAEEIERETRTTRRGVVMALIGAAISAVVSVFSAVQHKGP